MEKKIKEIVIRCEDGSEKVIQKGLLVCLKEKDADISVNLNLVNMAVQELNTMVGAIIGMTKGKRIFHNPCNR